MPRHLLRHSHAILPASRCAGDPREASRFGSRTAMAEKNAPRRGRVGTAGRDADPMRGLGPAGIHFVRPPPRRHLEKDQS